MKNFKIGYGAILVIGIIVAIGIGCTNYQVPDKNSKEISAESCEGCHIDYERLIEVHSD